MAFMNVFRRTCISACGFKPVQCHIPWTSQMILKPVIPAPCLLSSNKQAFSTNRNRVLASQHAEHNHSPMWTAEKVLSASLLGLVPAAFCFPSGLLDYAVALALTVHIHWGIEAIVIDYARPSVIGPTLARIAISAVYFFSALTLGGLIYFNYSDVGLMQAIRMLWKL